MVAITGQENNIPGALNKELERGPTEITSAFLCSFQLSLPEPLPDRHGRYRYGFGGRTQVIEPTKECLKLTSEK